MCKGSEKKPCNSENLVLCEKIDGAGNLSFLRFPPDPGVKILFYFLCNNGVDVTPFAFQP